MALVSVEAQDASLSMSYGASKGAAAPSSLEVALFVGDPADGGTELTSGGGYIASVVSNNGTTWPDAPAGGSVTSAPVVFATSTGAWDDTADYFLIRDASTGDEWDSGPLSDQPTVNGAGVVVRVSLTVFYSSIA